MELGGSALWDTRAYGYVSLPELQCELEKK